MKNIKNYIEQFKNWLNTDEKAKDWEKERQERTRFFKEKLNLQVIDNLSAEDFSEMIKSLWASNVWRNKDYKVKYLIENNGLEKIRRELKELLHGKDPIENRWDKFRNSVKGLGPSSTSEILTFFDPQNYGLINQKIYKVLPRLEIPIKLVKEGKSYQEALEKLKIIKNELEKNGIKNVDFVITDFFIAFLFYKIFDLYYERKRKSFLETEIEVEEEKKTKKVKMGLKKIKIDSHEKAEAVLLELGNLLGFDTYTPDKGRVVESQSLGDIATLKELPYFGSEKIMESANNIDVVWVKDEWPEYFFEVEHTTGITQGLLRIYRVAEKLSAKCFIIAPEKMLSKFKKEIDRPPFNKIKERYKFKSYEELQEMYLIAQKYQEIYEKFFEN